MQWFLFVIIGASLNVLGNWGYKVLSTKTSIFLIASGVSAVTAIALFSYAMITKAGRVSEMAVGVTPLIIVAMGCCAAAVTVLFITALSKGPLSLVDPLWACLYSLVSVAIGMVILREAPSATALAGIGLYLVGAFLMARG